MKMNNLRIYVNHRAVQSKKAKQFFYMHRLDLSSPAG